MTAGSDQCASGVSVRGSLRISVASPNDTMTSRSRSEELGRHTPVASSRWNCVSAVTIAEALPCGCASLARDKATAPASRQECADSLHYVQTRREGDRAAR